MFWFLNSFIEVMILMGFFFTELFFKSYLRGIVGEMTVIDKEEEVRENKDILENF